MRELTAISSHMVFQIAAIFTFYKSNWEKVQTFKRPLQCHGLWGCFLKYNVAFLLNVTLYELQCTSVVEQTQGFEMNIGGARTVSSFLINRTHEILLWSGRRWGGVSQPFSREWATWATLRYVSFLDSTALLKIRYQRTTEETSHKDQLFLNTFDIDSSHSFRT